MSEWKSAKYWKNRPVAERLENLKIPRRYKNITMASYNPNIGDKNAYEAILTWQQEASKHVSEGMGLYIYGDSGVGKTHLAQALLKELVTEHTLSGMFIPTTTYIEMMYDEIRNNGELPEEYADQNVAKYLRRIYDVVILDSLGEEHDSDFTKRSLMSFLENRYNCKLTTIITSNLSPMRVKSRYGERFHSILHDCCMSIPVLGDNQRITQDYAGE